MRLVSITQMISLEVVSRAHWESKDQDNQKVIATVWA